MEAYIRDLVTLSEYIPQDAIAGIIDTMDTYEMKQVFARTKGIKEGTRITYNGCNPIERNKTESKTIRLDDVLEDLTKSNLMTELLKKDLIIKQDALQYSSKTHGSEHTRRVNFFAIAIMNMEGITGRDKDIILEIVKNHDIGREHDWEDDEHGGKSVSLVEENIDRLKGFSEEEQKLIKFVIEQHSKSAKQNDLAVSKLPEDIREKYSRILKLFKDADKLDRVRLDPQGVSKEYGLDPARLSLDSSKKLIGVAYEMIRENRLINFLDSQHEKNKTEVDIMSEKQKPAINSEITQNNTLQEITQEEATVLEEGTTENQPNALQDVIKKDNIVSQGSNDEVVNGEILTFAKLIERLKEQGAVQELLECDTAIQELYGNYMETQGLLTNNTQDLGTVEELDYWQEWSKSATEELIEENNPFSKVDINQIRTINFFAIALTNIEGISDKDRKVVLEIIKNADIARIIRNEAQKGIDTSTLASSVEKRLEGFDKEDQELIKFVLNYCNLPEDKLNYLQNKLPENLRERCNLTIDLVKNVDDLYLIKYDPHWIFQYKKNPSWTQFKGAKMLAEVAEEICCTDEIITFLDSEKPKKQSEHDDSFNVERSQNENPEEQNVTGIEIGQTGPIYFSDDETEMELVTDLNNGVVEVPTIENAQGIELKKDTSLVGQQEIDIIISDQSEKAEGASEEIPVILKSTENWSKIKLTFQRLKTVAEKFKNSIIKFMTFGKNKELLQKDDSPNGHEK